MKSLTAFSVHVPHTWVINTRDIPGLEQVRLSHKDQIDEIEGLRLKLERHRISTTEWIIKVRLLHDQLASNPHLHISLTEAADTLFNTKESLYNYEETLIASIKRNLVSRVADSNSLSSTLTECRDLINLHRKFNRLLRRYFAIISLYIGNDKWNDDEIYIRDLEAIAVNLRALADRFPLESKDRPPE